MKTLSEMLESQVRNACVFVSEVVSLCTSAASEHLAGGGSRLRASISLGANVRLGLRQSDANCAAAVCELLHDASLVQDDLLDRTTHRRGAPSVWVKHGDTVAVCTGDLMLSSAYGSLCELSLPTLIVPALRLVHQRTSEVILGEAAEGIARQTGRVSTTARYVRLAKAKSASLLSLSLELPLLLSGATVCAVDANKVASDFPVAYQIADDLADIAQDTEEGSSNLLLSLMERDGLSRSEACACATELATEYLESVSRRARDLPHNCAGTLVRYAETLRRTMAERSAELLATAGV